MNKSIYSFDLIVTTGAKEIQVYSGDDIAKDYVLDAKLNHFNFNSPLLKNAHISPRKRIRTPSTIFYSLSFTLQVKFCLTHDNFDFINGSESSAANYM